MTEILVTGAAGKTGRAVTRALLARGVRVRAGVRPGSRTPVVDDPEVLRVPLDLATGAGLITAMTGVDGAYLIAPNVDAREVQMVRHAVESACAAGVPRLAYHSVLHPGDAAMPHHLRKLAAEEVLRAACPEAVVLRPAAYHQNLLAAALAGRIAVPYRLDAVFTNVDLDDIAEVAAGVLTTGGHEGATFDLAGPLRHTTRDLATIAARVLATPVLAAEIERRDWLAGPGAVVPMQARDDLLAMFTAYDRDGFAGDCATLRGLLGREPGSWAQVLRRAAGRPGPAVGKT